jgi:hypothetical protein
MQSFRTSLQDLRVVERLPDLLARRLDSVFTGQLHDEFASLPPRTRGAWQSLPSLVPWRNAGSSG